MVNASWTASPRSPLSNRPFGGDPPDAAKPGTNAEFDFDLHALRRIDYIGVTFRTRTLDEVREIGRRMRADLWDAVTAGKLTLPIDRRFPLDQAVEAHAHMRANKHFGKIVLTM
jgi:NADPH2:quinone reductase